MAQFAVKVGHPSLGPSEGARGQIAHLAQPFGEDAQSGAFARTAIAGGEGKAAVADLLFDAPAEAFNLGKSQQSRGRDLLGERVKFEAVEAQEFFVHGRLWGSSFLGR